MLVSYSSLVFLCFSSSPSTPFPKHPLLKTPSPKRPPFPNILFWPWIIPMLVSYSYSNGFSALFLFSRTPPPLNTPFLKHSPLKHPLPKTPSGLRLYPCWHHFIQWVFSAFSLLPLNTSFPNTHTPQILMFVLNFILPLKPFTFIIIHQIFCLYAISLNASHDRICPS